MSFVALPRVKRESQSLELSSNTAIIVFNVNGLPCSLPSKLKYEAVSAEPAEWIKAKANQIEP